ncbi:uncharacterized protein LOC118408404 isoform X2 [Branchiostoma floridae]|uniref:Uncharacterized protein LOC118408404 isoform X2 n=1 Tax=Branchiostoma floridae TaxID=7739 RepID=A0A9J7HSI5_BRAFL|nr:uncharacterized protein LOC118408404 isoform X2 [Branchiostoma floridae]
MSFPFKVLWFLAAAHLLLGLLAVLLGIADIVTHVQANPDGGFEVTLLAAPIWCGIPFLVAGGLGLAVSPYKPNVQEQTRQHWICCMINSILFGPIMFIIAMVDLFLEVQTSSIQDRDISFEIGFIIISVLETWCALGSVTIYCLYKAPRQAKEPEEGEVRLSPFSLLARHCTACSAFCNRRRHADKNSWVTGDDDTEVVITSSGAGLHDNESGVHPIPEDASPEEKELFLVARRLEEENVRLQKQLKVKSLKAKVKKLQQNNRALSHKLNKVHDGDSESIMIKEEEIRMRLKEAQTSKNVNAIKNAIKEFQDAKLEDFSEDLPAAQKQLLVLELKAALDKAISNRQVSKIGSVLTEIKKKGLQDVMSSEVARANKMLILIKQMDKLRQEVMNIKQSTIAEIRSYKNASEPVHKVMTATFLLLGEHEKDIKDWSALKILVGKSGKDALKQRVEHCNVAKIPAAVATKVQEMLVPFRLEEVRDHSAGAATFFLWANGMADEVLEGAAQGAAA